MSGCVRWLVPCAVGVLLLNVCCAAVSASGDDGLAECREIADPGKRLACYDRLAAPRQEAAEELSAPAAPPPAAAPEETESLRPPVSGRRGLEDNGPQGESADLTDVKIASISVTATGRHRFRLANGELWEQVEPRATDLRQGDRVSVTETLFGAWRMREQSGATRAFKVRRLE